MSKIKVINFALGLFNDSIEYGIGEGSEMPKGADFLIVEKILNFSKNVHQVWHDHTRILMLDDEALVSGKFSHNLCSEDSERREEVDILFVSDDRYLSLVADTNLSVFMFFDEMVDGLVNEGDLDFIPNAIVFVIHYVNGHETYHEIDKWRLFFLSSKQRRNIQSALDKKNVS